MKNEMQISSSKIYVLFDENKLYEESSKAEM